MGRELEPVIKDQLANFDKMLGEQPDGEYYIPDMLPTDQGASSRLFNRLTMELAIRFPNFMFEQRMSLRPQDRGVLVIWRKRYRAVQKERTDADQVQPRSLGGLPGRNDVDTYVLEPEVGTPGNGTAQGSPQGP